MACTHTVVGLKAARGSRDCAMLLLGFAALRRSELMALRVKDVAAVAGGLRLRVPRSKTDPGGEGAELGLPRGRQAQTYPVRALEDWREVARRDAGPLFRRISTAGRVGDAATHQDVVRLVPSYRARLAGLVADRFERLSSHALRVGFVIAAYGTGVRDEDIMRQTRRRDLATMRGYVRRPRGGSLRTSAGRPWWGRGRSRFPGCTTTSQLAAPQRTRSTSPPRSRRLQQLREWWVTSGRRSIRRSERNRRFVQSCLESRAEIWLLLPQRRMTE